MIRKAMYSLGALALLALAVAAGFKPNLGSNGLGEALGWCR